MVMVLYVENSLMLVSRGLTTGHKIRVSQEHHYLAGLNHTRIYNPLDPQLYIALHANSYFPSAGCWNEHPYLLGGSGTNTCSALGAQAPE